MASAPAGPMYLIALDAEAATRKVARRARASVRCRTQRTPARPGAARTYTSDGRHWATVTGGPAAHLVRWLVDEILSR
ncbi:hypothetical protein N5079_15710 [Planotetraspora sp. A-T 1434]|uniref:hypothetical protein n=1 Tax=Planotetraspora sp. A-T 1434 TaxID=2979219 RepID=UPI0021C18ECE|nr:hypothetical protein [Planotetraspora sp. A-T 1434]MCT9931660.1 hypothetical protein [Planotetraspora sp. A-T 1434]